MDEQQYTKWFNLGYELSKEKTDLSGRIAKALSKSENSMALGFIDGHNQYSQEIGVNKLPEYNKKRNYNVSATSSKIAKNKDIGKSND